MIDKDALIAHLQTKAVEAPVADLEGTTGMLVRFAMYQGLADMIRRGDFDRKDADT